MDKIVLFQFADGVVRIIALLCMSFGCVIASKNKLK